MQEIDGKELKMSGREAQPEQVLPEAGAIIMDDDRYEEELSEREEAFQSEPEWKGRLLQPFSFSRKALFYQLRLAMGAPDLGTALSDGSAFLADAIRILFICSHDPADYRALRSKPALLQEHIDEWGDGQITSYADAMTATRIALSMFNASSVNQAEAVQSGGPGRDDELGN